ncbi:unnamed protein product [Clonostachys rosea]|uniref:Major facilitator superfamily (MFS) profile domain-containing protein n=1 Tax=Bionectria ochroleuca TaxID=29856 RepID=A0ABY6U4J2_BIOOC|nr:unnamed protein product [Clonostachys rosea]
MTTTGQEPKAPSSSENNFGKGTEHRENASIRPGHVTFVEDDPGDRPQVHLKTWIAVAAMWIVNFTGVLALNGPPTILSYMAEDLQGTANQTWIANSISLVQAVICPVLCSVSDVFQMRKHLLLGCAVISFVGCAIAPGSANVYRVIAAQTMIGFGFASIPLCLSIPSEILPRKWRPQALGMMNVAASLGASVGPIVIGSLTKDTAENGWRYFYWFQMGLWGLAALGVLTCYQPPKRHTLLDHLSLPQKVGRIDIIGAFLMTAGLALFLAALNLGGTSFPWASTQVLCPLLVGIAVLVAFAFYEWKGTTIGILHHDLFRLGKPYKRTLIICYALVAVEGAVLFSYVIFYPIMTETLFETDPLLVAVRLIPFWLASGLSTMAFGWFSTKFRTIKYPLAVGYLIYLAGMVGFSTIQPGHNANAVAFAIVSGLGFGGPLILIFSGVQLCVPHSLLATATALCTSVRSVAGVVFTTIYSAIYSSRISSNISSYVSKAVTEAGLPTESIGPFTTALTNADAQNLSQVKGVNDTIIRTGEAAMKNAYADSLRYSFIIAAAIGVIGFILCFFIGDLKSTMNYQIDAGLEKPSVELIEEN